MNTVTEIKKSEINVKNKIANTSINKIYAVIGGFFAFSVLFAPYGAGAVNSDIARWYSSDTAISSGAIVSINAGEADKVEIASNKKTVKLLGVAVAEGDATASFNKSASKNVQIAVAGRSKAKVNLSKGGISRGDYIGLSNTPGVGAKAMQGEPVIGVAESSFGEKDSKASDQEGKVALIVSVGVAPYADSRNGANSTTWVRSFAGKDVSALQMAFLFLIAIVAIVSIVILTYSSIRNSFIAAGRNPMAKPAIIRTLSQVMIMVCIVAMSSFGLMFFILRL